MKKFLIVAAAMMFAAPAMAADVSASVRVGQPGFYGRLDIGDSAPPQVIYAQPRLINRVAIRHPPVYMRVPPGHAKNWSKHCRHYRACGERVYFVEDSWYNDEFVPRYRERHPEQNNHANQTIREHPVTKHKKSKKEKDEHGGKHRHP
ncbi:MAG: hypothetical protein PHU06_08020 [Gallionella sp.]|nr:hypothetical protein [Gallionella sp.]MDD4960188.1 hypothetical protein [Gallionella sp.]